MVEGDAGDSGVTMEDTEASGEDVVVAVVAEGSVSALTAGAAGKTVGSEVGTRLIAEGITGRAPPPSREARAAATLPVGTAATAFDDGDDANDDDEGNCVGVDCA